MVIDRNQIRSAAYIGVPKGDQSASKAAGILFAFAAYGFGTAESPDFTRLDYP